MRERLSPQFKPDSGKAELSQSASPAVGILFMARGGCEKLAPNRTGVYKTESVAMERLKFHRRMAWALDCADQFLRR